MLIKGTSCIWISCSQIGEGGGDSDRPLTAFPGEGEEAVGLGVASRRVSSSTGMGDRATVVEIIESSSGSLATVELQVLRGGGKLEGIPGFVCDEESDIGRVGASLLSVEDSEGPGDEDLWGTKSARGLSSNTKKSKK